jgi:PIN domain nuclease of toxin-antitoxin system
VCRNYPENAPQILKTVRKMVTLTATIKKDYCSGAARRKEASGLGKKLSTIDCVGYSVANRLKIPFLTGDREFADMSNVQFVR